MKESLKVEDRVLLYGTIEHLYEINNIEYAIVKTDSKQIIITSAKDLRKVLTIQSLSPSKG